jgi:hypothetical protein
MILGSVPLHVGIGLTMGLAEFLMMLCLLYAFVPTEAVHRLPRPGPPGRIASRPRDRTQPRRPRTRRDLAPAR